MANLPKYFYFRVNADGLNITVEDASNVDVAEVVRCFDCKYYPTGTEGFDLEWPNNTWDALNPCPFRCNDSYYSCKPKPDFYCAYGERKEEI